MTEPRQPVFGLFANTGKTEAIEALAETIGYLQRKRLPFLLEEHVLPLLALSDPGMPEIEAVSRDEVSRRADVVITFGGDGTLLAAVQSTLLTGTPLLGVNLGKLGFLADVHAGEVVQAIDRICADSHSIEARMTITGVLEQQHTFHALNDIVVSKSGSAKVISIVSHVNGAFLASFLADGIIISTPTGSTAYSLATGGPIVVPSSNVLIVSPISAHTLTARPIIVAGDSRISISADTDEGAITVMSDGQTIVENRKHVDLALSRGEHSVRLVKNIGPDYYETLRIKLSWAHDGRFHRGTTTTEQS